MLGVTLDIVYGPPADQRDHTTFISVLSNAYLKNIKIICTVADRKGALCP